MKKAVLILTVSILMMAGGAYGAGDLEVSGKLGIGKTPVYPLDIVSTDQRAINIVTTKTATGWEQGAVNISVTDSQTSGAKGNIGGLVVSYTHDGSMLTNHFASRISMGLAGTGSTTLDAGKIAQTASIVFKGDSTTGAGYNYTNPYAYAFASRASIMTLGTKTHYIRNIGGLQILHSYDNSIRTLSAENLYGIIVGDISQYSSAGLDSVANAGGIQVNKQTDSAGGRIGNLQGIWLNGDGAGADLVLGANKETRLYGSSGDLIIDTAGKMGIGTTNPTAKLQVAGGDAYTSTAGNGLIVKSPDGAICKRIGIDNSGNIVATAVTCP